jgi:hypothetical protein
MVVAGRPLEGVRSVGAVKWCPFTAGHGCEGPQPSRPQSIIVATNEWSLLADLLGVRSLGAVKWCPFTAGNGCAVARRLFAKGASVTDIAELMLAFGIPGQRRGWRICPGK